MSLLLQVQQQNTWLTFDNHHLTRSDTRPRPSRAAMAIADFEGAVSSVISLEGSPAHAVALIEKRLRSDGLIDGESKILIHKSRTVGAGYQTLFTAVPLDVWQQVYAWAEAQPDHCLLVPMTSLLWNALKPGQGIVLQSGRQLSVLALLKHDMLYRSSLAYSDDPDDLAMTAGALAEQFADDLSRGEDNLEPLDMKWCPVLVPKPDEGQPWLDDNLREIFSSRSGLQISTVPLQRILDDNGNEYRSGADWMASTASTSIAVNPGTSRGAYLAEWGLPLASAASLVFALALGTLGMRWTLNASDANTRSQRLDAQITETEARIAALDAEAAMPDDFQPILDFVQRARKLQRNPDPVEGLNLVRAAAEGQVRILRVRVEEPVPAGALTRGNAPVPNRRCWNPPCAWTAWSMPARTPTACKFPPLSNACARPAMTRSRRTRSPAQVPPARLAAFSPTCSSGPPLRHRPPPPEPARHEDEIHRRPGPAGLAAGRRLAVQHGHRQTSRPAAWQPCRRNRHHGRAAQQHCPQQGNHRGHRHPPPSACLLRGVACDRPAARCTGCGNRHIRRLRQSGIWQ